MNKHITPLALALALGIATFPSIVSADERAGHGSHTPIAVEAADSRVYTANGVISSIDAQSGKLTIAHEAIPALGWPKMTMRFGVETSSLLREVKEGDAVRFDFRNSNGAAVIVDMETE